MNNSFFFSHLYIHFADKGRSVYGLQGRGTYSTPISISSIQKRSTYLGNGIYHSNLITLTFSHRTAERHNLHRRKLIAVHKLSTAYLYQPVCPRCPKIKLHAAVQSSYMTARVPLSCKTVCRNDVKKKGLQDFTPRGSSPFKEKKKKEKRLYLTRYAYT